MLWIEYNATKYLQRSYVKNILQRIAEIIVPYPVCAYDSGKFGIGLITHDEIYQESVNAFAASTATSNSENLPTGRYITPKMDLSSALIQQYNDCASLNDGIQALGFRTDLVGDGHVNDEDNDDNGRSGNDDAAETGQIRGNGGGDRDLNNFHPPVSPGEGNDNNEDENEGDNGSPAPAPEDPDTPSKRPHFGTFTGTTRLYIDNSLRQELEISFDLRIDTRDEYGDIHCGISLDNLIVRASRMFRTQHTSSTSALRLDPFYVTDRTQIIFGPSGRCRGPRSIFPLFHYFSEKQSISSNNRFDLGIEASATPKAVCKGSKGSSKTIDRIPVTLAVEPGYIGSGERQDFEWNYKATSASETHLELSSTNPPIHKATYTVLPLLTPEHFRVKIETIYRQKGIPPRTTSSSLGARFRFIKDFSAKHIIMSLEITIGKEQVDHFQFPGKNKEGSELDMELKFAGGKLGQGPPEVLKIGAVESKLCNAIPPP